MIVVDHVDTRSRSQVRRFVGLPYRLYRGDPRWVPPPRGDVTEALDRSAHPFYEHSDADFFVASRNARDVGRLAVLEHRPFNAHHRVSDANFYFFECENDDEAAAALFDRAFEWARSRRLTRMIGPKGLTALDGYGVLIDGFEHRQMMTMTNHNPPYYARLVEARGFVKDVDFVSFELSKDTFVMPERVRRVAERVRRRGELQVVRFSSKRALVRQARAIAETYNQAFVDNWEYAPLSPREIDFLVQKLMLVADHRLIKVIARGDAFVGFLLVFPDLSAALQRMRGRVTPWGLIDILIERRRTRRVAFNGTGILPEYQGRGGNALLYTEIERTIRESHFERAELPQVADTAVQMRRDLEELGARPIKTHRVYVRELA